MKKILVLTLGIMLMCLTAGCIESEETSIVDMPNYTAVNQTVTEIVKEKPFWYEREKTVVTGKVVKIIFNRQNRDVIVFEDNFVLLVYGAEKHHWQLGKIHVIDIHIYGAKVMSVQIMS